MVPWYRKPVARFASGEQAEALFSAAAKNNALRALRSQLFDNLANSGGDASVLTAEAH